MGEIGELGVPSSHPLDSLYKYVDIKSAMNILSSGRLKWSSPLLFNDPFDTPKKLTFNFTTDDYYSCLFKKLHSIISDDTLLSKSDNKLVSLLRHFPLETRYKTLHELENKFKLTNDEEKEIGFWWHSIESEWENIIPTMRILCLSQDKGIESMWHNYADKNTGAVLEFAPNAVDNSAFLMAKKVEYKDAPPLISQPDAWINWTLGIDDITFQNLLTEYEHLKKSSWSNEREWRIVSFEAKKTSDLSNDLFSYYQFHNQTLKKIYLGYKCNAEHKSAIYQTCQENYKHVTLYNVVLDEIKREYRYENYKPE